MADDTDWVENVRRWVMAVAPAGRRASPALSPGVDLDTEPDVRSDQQPEQEQNSGASECRGQPQTKA